MSAEHYTQVRRLYKLILRLHRNLPDELRILGDNYAREEFKRHKKCKPVEASIFLNEWRDYALSMSRQAAPVRNQRRAPEGEQVVHSKEVKHKGPGGVGTPGSAGNPPPRFGIDLTVNRVLQMTPEQIASLLSLKYNARGDNPDEPIDDGIDSVDTDVAIKQIQQAKQYIIDVEKEEREKLARGEIKSEDLTFQTTWWLQLFDEAVILKEKEQEEKIKEKNAKDEVYEKANEKAEKVNQDK